MPFQHPIRSYSRENILSLDPDQNGVYGIFSGNNSVYIGSGDLRERMLAHIDGDNTCITRHAPDQWTASVVLGDPTIRERELIQEYNPVCNQMLPPLRR